MSSAFIQVTCLVCGLTSFFSAHEDWCPEWRKRRTGSPVTNKQRVVAECGKALHWGERDAYGTWRAACGTPGLYVKAWSSGSGVTCKRCLKMTGGEK